MGKLRLKGAVAAVLLGLASSCVTSPPLKPIQPVQEATVPEVAPETSPEVPSLLEVPRVVLSERGLPPRLDLPPPHDRPSALDLDSWPFGWVDDSAQAARLAVAPRFWSDHKPLWRRALDAATPAPTATRLLQQAFRTAGSSDEAFRAAWHLWLVYREAALASDARSWLDKAYSLHPAQAAGLELAWDQLFRLNDGLGARALLPSGGEWTPDDARKVRLLRQKLFLGSLPLSTVGADNYVSTLALDNDDVWAGTWNGSVVRWSLSTGILDLLLAPGATVAPVKLLKITGWFVYAFQDQGLLRYSKVTGTWRTFPYPPGWTGLRVQAAVADGQESLWVAYLGQGLWHWVQGEWTLVDDGGGGPFLNALAPNGAGGFWIGTKDRGLWSWKDGQWASFAGPTNISTIEPSPEGNRWAVGTWGEGTWTLTDGRLVPDSGRSEFVVASAWSNGSPVWGTLDEGVFSGKGDQRQSVGALEGLPAGGVAALLAWNGRWIWGTSRGLGWWSEDENSALLR